MQEIAWPELFEFYIRTSIIKSGNQPNRLPHSFLKSKIIFETGGRLFF